MSHLYESLEAQDTWNSFLRIMGDRVEHEVSIKLFGPKCLDFVSKQKGTNWRVWSQRKDYTEGCICKMCLVDSRDQILQEGQGIESFLGDSQ